MAISKKSTTFGLNTVWAILNPPIKYGDTTLLAPALFSLGSASFSTALATLNKFLFNSLALKTTYRFSASDGKTVISPFALSIPANYRISSFVASPNK